MLDADTKTRIDSARDILVGKVPDPKSQVEQITIALIYKFMDDMDRQSEELGGKATFFSGKFRKYAWNHLLDKRLGGHERLFLYAEGIEKMNENENIPQLFRDIFKGVFLPYRDPETLNLFLKEINGFTYDHSERLGDAFEYLLSVLGSQGAAGQFRTPRHIIDFIVAVVDPQKHETILDPACGTAGFLISSYKHILAQNAKDRLGDLLTADERGRLMANFCGYDISPDMVRLSRVNLYLHGFAQPRIHEYDMLTSEERWGERFDVIMANPPFMTPKGGIRPHNRFSIKATRSEVLIVDYIAEHLNVNGRAGVIVPEGIIFQSQNAYKKLRRMLVEHYLWAVVSLPAGVFNPYAGVKTSILFLDKGLAKRADEILFVKVENDGFDLGAQRRQNGKNDLPEALKVLRCRHSGLDPESSGSPDSPVKPGNDKHVLALSVPRKRLLESPDCNLSGDRYRETAAVQSQWPMVQLAEVANIISGQSPEGQYYNSERQGLPFYQGKTEFGDTYLQEPSKWTAQTTRVSVRNDILMSVRAPVGPVNINPFQQICIGRGLAAIRPKKSANYRYVFYLLQGHEDMIRRGCGGSTFESINRSQIAELQIPLPPLAEQERIVAELEGYRKIIKCARQIIANYKPTIRIDPKWPMVKLSEVCEIKSGGTPSRSEKSFWGGDIPWVGSTVCKDDEVTTAEEYITQEGLKNSAAKVFPTSTTLIALVGATIGKTGLLKFDSTTNQNISGLYPKSLEVLDPTYLFHAARMLYPLFLKLGEGKFRMANLSFVREQKIPLPPLDIQRQIVAELEAERKLVEANRELIVRMEAKIKAKLAEVWGEETIDPITTDLKTGGKHG